MDQFSICSIIAISLLHQSSSFQSCDNLISRKSHCLSKPPIHPNVHIEITSLSRPACNYCSCNKLARRGYNSVSQTVPLHSMKDDSNYAYENDDISVVEEDELLVTDEEALLACRAYLQRKNKLGWVEAKRRKDLARNSLALAPLSQKQQQQNATLSTSSLEDMSQSSRNVNAGYFWEYPSELVYLKRSRPRRIVQKNKMLLGEDGDNGNDVINGGDSDEDYLLEFADDIDFNTNEEEDEEDHSNNDRLDFIDDEEITDVGMSSSSSSPSSTNNEESGGIFTSFPAFPPTSHLKQSQYRKALFSDPKWREEWYTKRWGGEKMKRKRAKINQKKKIQKLVQKIPSDVLRSPELAALTDEEIEDAIITYVKANDKRRKTHLKLKNEKLDGLGSINISQQQQQQITDGDKEDQTNNLPLSFTPSAGQLKEVQRRNSERARKAYETRIANKGIDLDGINERKQQRRNNLKEITVEGELSPRQAMERIEEMINDKKKPLITDVDTVLTPKRLSGRKELLKLILSECFSLKGKCVPNLSLVETDPSEFYMNATMDDVNGVEKKFVTQTTVSELGSFVKFMLI